MTTPSRDRSEAARALADRPEWEGLAEAISGDRDHYFPVDHRRAASAAAIVIVEGRGPQALSGEPVDTSFHAYYQQVIEPSMRAGAIGNGAIPGIHDDRKLRCSGYEITGEPGILSLALGPTDYSRYRQDLERDQAEALRWMLLGFRSSGDPYHYFACALGVAVIPISADGSVYIGERSVNVDRPGLLNFVGGLVTWSRRVAHIKLEDDIRNELAEEVGIVVEPDATNTRFIGIARQPFTGEADLVFVVQTTATEAQIEGAQLSEHQRLTPIRSRSEAARLLDYGTLPGDGTPKQLLYSSRLGLEYLRDRHFC